MKDISEFIFDYQDCLKELWHKHFIIDSAIRPDFMFEIDKAFSLVAEGLFISLVVAKTFDYQIERINNQYFDQILIYPISPDTDAIYAKQEGITWHWRGIKIKPGNHSFKYIELFDWTRDGEMKCEFVRTRLTASDTLSDHIGYDFLFSTTTVKYVKIE